MSYRKARDIWPGARAGRGWKNARVTEWLGGVLGEGRGPSHAPSPPGHPEPAAHVL